MSDLLPLLFILLVPAQPALVDTIPDTLDLSGHTVILSVDDGYHSVYSNIYPLLRRYRMPITLAVIGDYVGSGRPSYGAQERFMNRAEIQELIDSCDIEVASHTMSHAWLTKLDSADAWYQVARSRVFLESLFNVPVMTFVYPYGDMDERARRMVRRAGYRLGRAVRHGIPDLWNDPYRIPEVELRIETQLGSVERHVEHSRLTVVLLHRIVAQPKIFTEWPLADFAALLEWMHEHNVRVTTLSELYGEMWRERIARIMLEQLEESRKPGRLFEDVDVDATRTLHSRR